MLSSKQLILLIAILFALPIAHAAVDVEYFFTYSDSQQNTELNSTIYMCNDSNCSSVSAFPGSIIKGPEANDSVIFRYPDTLASPYGYVEFFVAKGYRPLEGKHDWHSFGDPTIYNTSENNTFTKYPNVCKATVSAINLTNTARVNEPLSIDALAQLDAQTSSAFRTLSNGVDYIPPFLIQEYYAADTLVYLDILDENNTVIHTQVANFTAQNGNAIVADTSLPVQFTYSPSQSGNYTARLTASVVDDACTSYENTSSTTPFTVTSVQGQFYSIISDAYAQPSNPLPGQNITVFYSKITNHVQNDTNLSPTITPVQTDVDYLVTKDGSTIYNVTGLTLFANSDANTSEQYNFSFTASESGIYTISISARANSALPTTEQEIFGNTTFQLNVFSTSNNNTITFSVKNQSGVLLEGAKVTLDDKTANTTSNGTATFENVSSGDHNYTVSLAGYNNATGILSVTADETISITLTSNATNTAPIMNLPQNLSIQSGNQTTLDLADYSTDQEDPDSALTYSFTGNSSFTIALQGSIATITAPNSTVNETITFTVYDTQNLSANSSIQLMSINLTPPAWQALSAITTNEDVPLSNVIRLLDYITSIDPASVVFKVLYGNSSLADVIIDANSYLTIQPKPDANGFALIAIDASDSSGANASTTLNLTVQPINDAPRIISTQPTLTFDEDNIFNYTIAALFYEPDGDAIQFNLIEQVQGISLAYNSTHLSIIPDPDINGNFTLKINASDPLGESVQTQIPVIINPINDNPRFTQAIPNITTFEEQQNSIDLTPYESDPEDGSGADGNSLVWYISLTNSTNKTSYLNTSIFEANLTTSTDLLLITPHENATGDFNITVWLSDSAGANTTQNITVTVANVNDAPYFVGLSNQSAQAGIPFEYSLNATDPDPTGDTLNFSTNSTFNFNQTSGTFNFTPKTSGDFPTLMSVCDNFGACTNSTFTITISDLVPPAYSDESAVANGTVYSPGATYQFSINWTDNGNLTEVTFEIDGNNLTNVSQSGDRFTINISDLSAGNHTYRWHASDLANNTNSTNSSTIEIAKAQANIELLLNSNPSNITVPQNDTINITANLTNTTGTIELLINGTQIANSTSPLSTNNTFIEAGNYTVSASFAGNENYTSTDTNLTVTVLDTTSPTISNTISDPLSPAPFSNKYTFNATISDNVAVDSAFLEVDNSSNTTAYLNNGTASVNVTGLAVGNHTMRWYANDTSGNLANYTFSYEVLKGAGSVEIKVNGASGNTTAQVNDSITIQVNVSNPSGAGVELYINGTLSLNASTTPATLNTTFNQTGDVNLTAIFPGDENASLASDTVILTIIPEIAITSITPQNATRLNYSTFTLSVETNRITSCSWDPADLAQQAMANNFTGNGTTHSANASLFDNSNYALGTFNLSVACNNQSSSSNEDLSYVFENILDGTNLTGSNNISSSIVIDGLVETSTLTNITSTNSSISNSTLSNTSGYNNTLVNVTGTSSNITDSTLSNCQAINSTVKSITAENCIFIDSFVDPSNLTGSTIKGASNIIESNVTFSNVTTSDINESIVNSSTIENSTIEQSQAYDSTIINSTTTGSIIDNSQISYSTAMQSNLTNVNAQHSTINSTQLNNATLLYAVIDSGVIKNGTITVGNFTYNATASGEANISQVVPVPPSVSFTPLTSTILTGQSLTFADLTFDANIPGPLNDSLTYLWTFGDGTNSTLANPPAKSWSAAGTYTVTLEVTDSFGFTGKKTGTITVTSQPSTSGGSSGGGGGGGGGGGAPRIILSQTPVQKQVIAGRAYQFELNGKLLPLTIVLRSARGGETEWALNGQFYKINLDESAQFDLTGDGVPDVEIRIDTIGRLQAMATFSLPGQNSLGTAGSSLLPNFNFQPSSENEGLAENPNREEEQTDGLEELEVQVEATIPPKANIASSIWDAVSSIAQKARSILEIDPQSKTTQTAISLFVVLIGLAAYGLWTRFD
ncbi:PKD domain-containing protein [Candidatus Woesearchaeota archaeon]|nr:MAG: PKD domain-containing protein [Candidatus Woesearchaeota archaeon]